MATSVARASDRLMVFTLSIATAAGAPAQQSRAPAGNWQSVKSETYSTPLHPVVTRAEFYLNIDVASRLLRLAAGTAKIHSQGD